MSNSCTSAMTLMELTAAYAGIAANEFPVEPHAFARGEQGWWEWLTTRSDSFSGGTHEDIETMLRAAINRGTGRNAVLPIANFGKYDLSALFPDAFYFAQVFDQFFIDLFGVRFDFFFDAFYLFAIMRNVIEQALQHPAVMRSDYAY